MEERIVVGDGKYTVVLTDNGKQFVALRHNERWRDLTGDGLILALFQEIRELQNGFHLNEDQEKKVRFFKEKHVCTLPKDPYGNVDIGASGGRFTHSFTGTSLGQVATISCACGSKMDLTDYESW